MTSFNGRSQDFKATRRTAAEQQKIDEKGGRPSEMYSNTRKSSKKRATKSNKKYY